MTSKLIVSKDNQLIHASYELTISEQRIILLCIAKMDSRKPVPSKLDITLSIDDMTSEIGIAKENAYRDLKKAVATLYNRTISIDPNEPASEMRLIYKKAFFKATGVVVLSFHEDILNYLFELKERFTTYRLKDVCKFKCSYSIRFYELLIQFKKETKLTVEVNWLREALQLGDKYPRTSDIKKYIVLPSVNDINALSNLKVEYDQIKRGKEIDKFIFTYELKEPEKPKITKAYIEKHAKPGETWEQASNRLRKQLENST
jgi:plasmid replication initiation protein